MADELAARTKIERTKQDEVRTGSSKRKSTPTVATPAIPLTKGSAGRGRKSKAHSSPNSASKLKKEKVRCFSYFIKNVWLTELFHCRFTASVERLTTKRNSTWAATCVITGSMVTASVLRRKVVKSWPNLFVMSASRHAKLKSCTVYVSNLTTNHSKFFWFGVQQTTTCKFKSFLDFTFVATVAKTGSTADV